jgi:dUTP pyrophosphatase
MNIVSVKKLTQTAQLPAKAHEDDAGFDLYSDRDFIVYPETRRLIGTGIAVAIPRGYYGRIAPRSGLAFKNGIDVLAGVVDAGYRNEVGVILINFGDKPFEIKNGDRVAQLIIEKVDPFKIEEVKEFFTNTHRGMSGWGSSGV